MQKPTPINEEYSFNKGLILSSTNIKGIITYANRKFCEISGYTKDELVGHNHNMIRHPDMPHKIFKELWETIELEKEWTGIVKNLRSDGRYYWVYTHISPILTAGSISGYAAARRPASKTEIEETSELYASMLEQDTTNE